MKTTKKQLDTATIEFVKWQREVLTKIKAKLPNGEWPDESCRKIFELVEDRHQKMEAIISQPEPADEAKRISNGLKLLLYTEEIQILITTLYTQNESLQTIMDAIAEEAEPHKPNKK